MIDFHPGAHASGALAPRPHPTPPAAGAGPRIITPVGQTIPNVIDFPRAADLAVAEPRVHHQHLPDVISIEAGSIDKATEEQLRAMDYRLHWGEPPRGFA